MVNCAESDPEQWLKEKEIPPPVYANAVFTDPIGRETVSPRLYRT